MVGVSLMRLGVEKLNFVSPSIEKGSGRLSHKTKLGKHYRVLRTVFA